MQQTGGKEHVFFLPYCLVIYFKFRCSIILYFYETTLRLFWPTERFSDISESDTSQEQDC